MARRRHSLTYRRPLHFSDSPPPPQVYIRERLNGYYRPSSFTVANTLASLPFILLIAVACTVRDAARASVIDGLLIDWLMETRFLKPNSN